MSLRCLDTVLELYLMFCVSMQPEGAGARFAACCLTGSGRVRFGGAAAVGGGPNVRLGFGAWKRGIVIGWGDDDPFP